MKKINNTNSDTLQEFIFEFNNRLEIFGFKKKFIEDVKSLGLKGDINLENINSYKNNDEWNKFLNIVDSHYAGLLHKFFPNIAFEKYTKFALIN